MASKSPPELTQRRAIPGGTCSDGGVMDAEDSDEAEEGCEDVVMLSAPLVCSVPAVSAVFPVGVPILPLSIGGELTRGMCVSPRGSSVLDAFVSPRKLTYTLRKPDGLNLGRHTGSHDADADELRIEGECIVLRRICRS
jgi:hypothetical protein